MPTSPLKKIRIAGMFLFRNDCLNFFERLRVISSLNRDTTILRLLLKKLIESNDGSKFFNICGYKVYFQPDYEIHDEKFFIKGITHALGETFFFPLYFSSKAYIKEGDVVLDLGAFIGTTTLLFSKIVGEKGKVFAFEPITHNVLSKNIRQNDIKNAEVIPKAVLEKPGKVEIEMSSYVQDSSTAKREYTKNYYTTRRIVDAISLDVFAEEVGLDRIDFIKMDIEGAEELAIRGAKKVIEKYRPKWSISSYHIDFNNESQHDKLVGLLEESGYELEEIRSSHIYAW